MSAPQSPAQSIQSFLSELRSYLRDYPELNRLIEGQEHSPRQMMWVIAEVQDDFSNTPPPIGNFDVTSIPRSIMLKGCLAELLSSEAIRNLRNSLSYSDGQVRVDLDKHQSLMALSQMFRSEYEVKRDRYKISQNISRSLNYTTGLHSEYFWLAGFYGNYQGTSKGTTT